MLAMAVAARNSLLLCGPFIFREGGAPCIANYTSGLSSSASLIQRLEALFFSIMFALSKVCMGATWDVVCGHFFDTTTVIDMYICSARNKIYRY